MPQRDTSRFPTGPSALASLLSKVAEATGVGPVRPLRTITGFKPDKHANARLHEWRKAVDPSHIRVSVPPVFEAEAAP
jgi:hypothetical protein